MNAPLPGDTGGKARLFVVSAPSGAGKTTLCSAVRRRFPDLVYSISTTTRPPREGEIHGVDYFFVDPETFRQGIEADRWAEWAKVHGHCYGTSAAFLSDRLKAGRSVLLDIDVQGARQILQRFPESVTVFIMPPSMAVLRARLEARGSDSPQTIQRRLAAAKAEMDQSGRYRHVVVNEGLAEAVDRLSAIIDRYLA